MRKNMSGVAITAALTIAMAGTAWAGTWRTGTGSEAGRWWYDNGNGTWPAGSWQWIDGDGDGLAECYYFDINGWLYTDGSTPDGSTVDGKGAWVVNGVVQTRNRLDSTSSESESGEIVISTAGYTNGVGNVVIDLLNNNRAANAAKYTETSAKNRAAYVEVTYSNMPFTVRYMNDEGQDNYSGAASGRPERVEAGEGHTYLLFRDAPTDTSANSCKDVLRGRGYNARAEKESYIVDSGTHLVVITPGTDTGYVTAK